MSTLSKRDEIMSEVTDAAGESTKIPRLQRELQERNENFDVIGLINFNWGLSVNKALPIADKGLRTMIKKKCALKYLLAKNACAEFQEWHSGLLRNS